MNQVNILDLKPGMILAKSVKNHQGVLLLDAGTKITKKNIRIFKSWGVMEIWVKGRLNKSENVAKKPVAVKENTIDIELKARFSDVLDDPVMVEIFKAATKQIKNKLPTNEHDK